jgi:OOP family OmpA-OmpF porin
MKRALWAVMLGIAGAAQAVELQLPASARQMITRDTHQDRYFAPVAPFADGVLRTQMVEGAVARSAWRIDVAGLTPLQIIAPLRGQLEAAGYALVLDCAAAECGGYDFRFETEVLPAPNMYVNIRNYHVLTGVRGEGADAITVLASASSGASFVQIIHATTRADAGSDADLDIVQAPGQFSTTPDGLLRDGYVVLDGLEFDSGTSELGQGPFDTIDALVEALKLQDDLRIALVGHTDNIGSPEDNIALSISRAQAVRNHLIERHGIAPERLEADGIGFLSPMTTNLTETGREANRRVEAVILSE